jgi:xanthine dehydrogenase accessory factor
LIMPQGCIWIQGAGELASGIGMRLARSGYAVAMAEIAHPLAVRRLVAFSEAIYSGEADVEGINGLLVAKDLAQWHVGQVAVFIDPRGESIPRMQPAAVIDARLTKLVPEPLDKGDCPVIGIGPGFCCGRDATFIVETHRGARMGEVINVGEAAPNTGVPGVVGGQSARRVVYAPVAGKLEPKVAIGHMVAEGDVMGYVGGEPILSGLDGKVRGLIHPLAELSAGVKVGDVDPRGSTVDPALVTDKALAIAGGVLECLLRLGIFPQAR